MEDLLEGPVLDSQVVNILGLVCEYLLELRDLDGPLLSI